MAGPQRIVSLLASATEILYGIGLGNRIVAVSHECDYPAEVLEKPCATRSNIDEDASSRVIDGQVRAAVETRQALYQMDEALLVQLAPDLIITQAQCDVCAVRYEDVLSVMKRHPCLQATAVVPINPMTLADIFDDILRVGDAADMRSAAEGFCEGLGARVANVRAKTEEMQSEERPRVVVIEWIDPPMLAAHWVPELVHFAGGLCGLTSAGQTSGYADWKDVLAYDPEVIVVAPCGWGLSRTVTESATLARFTGWPRIQAVRDGRVYGVDGNAYFNRSGPRLVDSLEILAHLIHPKRFDVPRAIQDPDRVWKCLAGDNLKYPHG